MSDDYSDGFPPDDVPEYRHEGSIRTAIPTIQEAQATPAARVAAWRARNKDRYNTYQRELMRKRKTSHENQTNH